ncbi:MAG: hypothetical protein R3324_08105, partial [Halobacteriales archaeon]|nr:hypothetical protein [Halobacteriales archaeon]
MWAVSGVREPFARVALGPKFAIGLLLRRRPLTDNASLGGELRLVGRTVEAVLAEREERQQR